MFDMLLKQNRWVNGRHCMKENFHRSLLEWLGLDIPRLLLLVLEVDRYKNEIFFDILD